MNSLNRMKFKTKALTKHDPSTAHAPIKIANETITSSIEVQPITEVDTIKEIIFDGMKSEFVSILRKTRS